MDFNATFVDSVSEKLAVIFSLVFVESIGFVRMHNGWENVKRKCIKVGAVF